MTYLRLYFLNGVLNPPKDKIHSHDVMELSRGAFKFNFPETLPCLADEFPF